MDFEPSIAVWAGRAKDALLGVSVAPVKDGSKLVLITTRDEVLEFSSSAARKCVNHWTFKAGSQLALRVPAVRNPQSQVLFGVRGGGSGKNAARESLVSWSNTDLEVAKWKSTPLSNSDSSDVHSLFVHPKLAREVVVLHADGSFAGYNADLVQVLDSKQTQLAASVDERDEADKTTVVWASLANNQGGATKGSLFLSMLLQSKDKSYELEVYQISSAPGRQDGQPLSCTLQVRVPVANANSEATITSGAFHGENFSYSIVWSTGEWQIVTLEHDAVTKTLEYVSTQQKSSFGSAPSTPAASPGGNKKRKLAAKAASPSSVFKATAIGNVCNLVVANASTPQALTGWDTKFGVQVASTSVDLTSDDASVDLSKPGKLVGVVSPVLGEVVAVAYERAVFLIKVKSKSSTLASVLGAAAKDKTTLAITTPAQPNASTEWVNVVAADEIDSESWTQKVCSDDATEQQLIAELTDAVATRTHAQFTKKFNEATKKLRKAGAELSYRFILSVTKRCVDSAAELTPWEPLKTLISSKRISARAVPSLLPVLMKHRQYELLELAILHFTDVDERSVVRLLKFFIRQSQDKALLQYVAGTRGAKPAGKRTKAAAKDNTAEVSACERFVVALLALPTNTVFLHRAIQSLELSEVLFLLAVCNKFVYALLATPSSAAAASVETPSKKRKTSKAAAASDETSPLFALVHNTSLYLTALPTCNQFCTWISAMLDAHVTPLIVAASADAKLAASLEQLETVVRGHLQSCEQYETVQSVLGNFLSSVKMPAAHGISEYSIEELCI